MTQAVPVSLAKRLTSALLSKKYATTLASLLQDCLRKRLAGAAAKRIRLDAHAAQHGNKEIAERRVVIAFEGDVLAVFETTTGQNDGKIRVVVDVGLAHVAAVKHHGAIQQTFVAFRLAGQIAQQFGEHDHLLAVCGFKLAKLLLVLSVVTEAVIALGGVLPSRQLEDRRSERIEHERDDARGVRLKCELRHSEHQFELFKKEFVVLPIRNARGRCMRGFGHGAQLPLARGGKALFDFAHGGEVLIEPRFVGAAEVAAETPGLAEQGIEDAAVFFEAMELLLHRGGVALHEHLLKQGRRAVFSRQQHTISRPGKAAVGLLDVDAEIERREARHLTEFFRRELIQRDTVAKARLECAARRDQEGQQPSAAFRLFPHDRESESIARESRDPQDRTTTPSDQALHCAYLYHDT